MGLKKVLRMWWWWLVVDMSEVQHDSRHGRLQQRTQLLRYP